MRASRNAMHRVRDTARSVRNSIRTAWDDLLDESKAHPSLSRSVVFGPVPSRRLGRSLGINTLSTKACSYNCVYCQAGRTTACTIHRQDFANPYQLYFLVKERLRELSAHDTTVDYISFVPNGEPTLECSLWQTIRLLREFGIPIAVFTNSSLLWNERVREDLMCADYVSVKVDTAVESTWHRLNRPHQRLHFEGILEGIVEFSRAYGGELTTETMFINGMNDTLEEVRQLGAVLARIRRSASWFAVPTRPPLEAYATAPPPQTLENLRRMVNHTIAGARWLCCPENTDFDGPDDVQEALLGILAVHPMSAPAIEQFLNRKKCTLAELTRLLEEGLVRAVEFSGTTFYTRTEHRHPAAQALHHA